MTTVLDIWNQALSECGARATVAATTELSKEAQTLSIHYSNVRTSVLRGAPWSCARVQVALDVEESYLHDPVDNQYPWLFSYTYPEDCVQMRYLLRPPSAGTTAPGWGVPDRNNRFLPGLNTDGDTRVILTNVESAIGVYTKDLTDVNLWDQGLQDAIVASLCAKIVIPMTGNVAMKSTFEQLASRAIVDARVQDANEAKPTTDHTPDWITARGCSPMAVGVLDNLGFWYTPHVNLTWGE